MGIAHMNPILDTRMCQAEHAGGEVTELTANLIAESIYAQCDANETGCILQDVLVDYHKDNKMISITEKQSNIWGRPVTCNTTPGWQICCQQKDGSTSLKKLSELKELHPVKTAEIALCRGSTMSLLLTGGFNMCSRKETEQLPAPESGKKYFLKKP